MAWNIFKAAKKKIPWRIFFLCVIQGREMKKKIKAVYSRDAELYFKNPTRGCHCCPTSYIYKLLLPVNHSLYRYHSCDVNHPSFSGGMPRRFILTSSYHPLPPHSKHTAFISHLNHKQGHFYHRNITRDGLVSDRKTDSRWCINWGRWGWSPRKIDTLLLIR
jgi:hypothetical protein